MGVEVSLPSTENGALRYLRLLNLHEICTRSDRPTSRYDVHVTRKRDPRPHGSATSSEVKPTFERNDASMLSSHNFHRNRMERWEEAKKSLITLLSAQDLLRQVFCTVSWKNTALLDPQIYHSQSLCLNEAEGVTTRKR